MMALGASASTMLHAESTAIGTLQQSPRDGRRIVPAEIDPPAADTFKLALLIGMIERDCPIGKLYHKRSRPCENAPASGI
jgi:hypothetical protein